MVEFMQCTILRIMYIMIIRLNYIIEKNKMGGACGTYGVGERCAQGSSGET